MNDKLRQIQDKRNRFISAPKSFVCVSDYVDDTGYLLSEIDRLNGELEKANYALDVINGKAISWSEDGPFEDANTEGCKRMHDIEQLSRSFVKPPQGKDGK